MLEFLALTGTLGFLLTLAGRRGVDHLLSSRLVWTLSGVGWGMGVVVESLPTTAVSPGFTFRTALAGLLGLFIGRILSRVAQAWAFAHRDWAVREDPEPPRLLHPVIAVGLFLTGVPVLYAAASARHEALEYETTIRDLETGIVRGAEEISLEPDQPTDHAVLLIHGFLGSPAEFGDLPEALRLAGLAVRAPLLPGHGTRPDDLSSVLGADHVKAVAEAWDELAKAYPRVSVLGFSMGGTAAILASEGRKPHRLVLVNPFVGAVATPDWCPLDTDSLIGIVSKLTTRVMRPEMFARLEKRENLPRLRIYRTVAMRGAVELQQLGLRVGDRTPWQAPAPTLTLVSELDEAVPPGSVEAFIDDAQAPGGEKPLIRYAKSNHLLFVDYDAAAATTEVLDWLRR